MVKNINHQFKQIPQQAPPPSSAPPPPPFAPPPQIFPHTDSKTKASQQKKIDSQFQQGQIGIAVISPVLALLGDIVLEDGRRFGIVPVQAVEDGFDVFGPVGRIVKGDAHGFS